MTKMKELKLKIMDISEERGSPIIDYDDFSRTVGDVTWFIGRDFFWRIESVSKSGKTIKGRKCSHITTKYIDFSRVSTKTLIEDVLRRTKNFPL
jgi:hypothetical protein